MYRVIHFIILLTSQLVNGMDLQLSLEKVETCPNVSGLSWYYNKYSFSRNKDGDYSLGGEGEMVNEIEGPVLTFVNYTKCKDKNVARTCESGFLEIGDLCKQIRSDSPTVECMFEQHGFPKECPIKYKGALKFEDCKLAFSEFHMNGLRALGSYFQSRMYGMENGKMAYCIDLKFGINTVGRTSRRRIF